MQSKTQLDKYARPLDGPIARKQAPDKMVPWQWGNAQKVQTDQIRMSRMNVKNPGTLSATATALGTVGAGSTLFVFDTLTPASPHSAEMNFAVPYVAVYEGTAAVASRQLYPVLGGSQTWGSYSFQTDFDFNSLVSNSTGGSALSTYNLTIHNNMASPGTFFYVNTWKFLNLNLGKAQ